MDIDARFVKDIEVGDRLNVIQFVAHLGLVDGSHYYLRTVISEKWGRMIPSIAHEAAHEHFGAIQDEFPLILRNFLAQVYCRAFMQVCAHYMLSSTRDDDVPIDMVSQLVTSGELKLHFIGLEDTASEGISVAQLYEKEVLDNGK